MNDPCTPQRDEAMSRLTEIVLDHLGIPRPGTRESLTALEDRLLPVFLDVARQAWLTSSPLPPATTPNESKHPTHRQFQAAIETHSEQIRRLNDILEQMGVHALLEDVAGSPDAAMLANMPIDPYEERILRAAGHPGPHRAVLEYLRRAANEPAILRGSDSTLENAAQSCLNANNVAGTRRAAGRPNAGPAVLEKPKRRKLFSGVGKLFSGLALLSGNAIVAPNVVMASVAAAPILVSLASGIAAVGEGIGQIRREGE